MTPFGYAGYACGLDGERALAVSACRYVCVSPDQLPRARQALGELSDSLVFVTESPAEMHLHWGENGLTLCGPGDVRGAAIPARDVLRRAGTVTELVRACGVARSRPSRVLDAFSGWGVDGLTLALRGCNVTAVERDAAVVALNRDLAARVERASGQSLRYKALHADAFAHVICDRPWDVVYFDPMFPERAKRALPGKRLQYLQAIVSADERALADWIEAARAAAVGRIVVKRRRNDPVDLEPSWQIRGRSIRYDVYG